MKNAGPPVFALSPLHAPLVYSPVAFFLFIFQILVNVHEIDESEKFHGNVLLQWLGVV